MMMIVKKKILIVDDSSLIVEKLSEILRDVDSIEVVSKAASYSEAVELLAANPTDIAFLDIKLPGKNGIELLKFIKANYPGIKVIMLTNQVSEHYRKLCKNMESA